MRTLAAMPLFALMSLAALPSAAQEGPVTIAPEQIAQIFCIARLGNDMAPVEALLTPELTAAIAEAEANDAAWAAANPGEKPPLGDGIPWQAWPDYAPECTAGEVSLEMNESRVGVRYAFPDQADANFEDRLHLKLIPGEYGWNVWRIDDISYATEGDLRTALTMAFMEN